MSVKNHCYPSKFIVACFPDTSGLVKQISRGNYSVPRPMLKPEIPASLYPQYVVSGSIIHFPYISPRIPLRVSFLVAGINAGISIVSSYSGSKDTIFSSVPNLLILKVSIFAVILAARFSSIFSTWNH